MSFQRNTYDPKAYNHQLEESLKAGKYNLLSDYGNNSGKCFRTNPGSHIGHSGLLEVGKIVDAESDLYNLNRRLTKDPKKQFPFLGVAEQHVFPEMCGNPPNFETKHSMLDSPRPNRGKPILKHHYETLCRDPQKLTRIHDNSYIGMNTQLWERDNYKPKLPTPLPQGLVLPQEPKKNPSTCKSCDAK